MSAKTLSHSRSYYYFRGQPYIYLICDHQTDEDVDYEWYLGEIEKETPDAYSSCVVLQPCSGVRTIYCRITPKEPTANNPVIIQQIQLKELREEGDDHHAPLQLIVELKDMQKNASNITKLKKLLKVSDRPARYCPGQENIQLWEWDEENEEEFKQAKRLCSDWNKVESVGNGSTGANLPKEEELGLKRLIDTCILASEDNYVRPLSFIEDGDHSTGRPHLHDPDRPGANNIRFMPNKPVGLPHFFLHQKEKARLLPEDKSTVLVGIIDSGIAFHADSGEEDELLASIAHKNLLDNKPPLASDGIFGYNFVDNDALPFDDNGHGTELANIILTGGAKAIDPQIRILPIKTHDQNGLGLMFNCLSGMYYAIEKGADVINISWGYTSKQIYFMEKAIQKAEDKGILVITSAGNIGRNNDEKDHDHFPSNFSRNKGGNNNIIAVSSLSKDGKSLLKFDDKNADPTNPFHAHGSNYGVETVQIAAIGDDYESVYLKHLKDAPYNESENGRKYTHFPDNENDPRKHIHVEDHEAGPGSKPLQPVESTFTSHYPRRLKGTSYATAKVTNAVGKFLLDRRSIRIQNAADKKNSFLTSDLVALADIAVNTPPPADPDHVQPQLPPVSKQGLPLERGAIPGGEKPDQHLSIRKLKQEDEGEKPPAG